ncbi:condensation domain-containing protein, partial [Janthinobacterium sp. PSPC1-1]|uniref:condensation domain-containing protein n=1 Tax=Janthinobacterium sp. PSPC1-1 TaxID=2804581 RepID=UPI003CEFE43E
DGDALQQAVQEIVRRHEVLRTTFASVDGTAVQVIAPALALSMPRSDLAALPSAQRALALRALAGQEALHGFDLATGPLLRVHLVRMAANEHVLLLTVHHIVSDGWSTGVLLHELGVLYRAFVQGQTSPLPELALQYADFAHWQRQWLSGDVLQAQLDYWSARMAGSAAMLNLPTDHPRPALQQHHGALHRFSIDAASTAGLQALAQQQGATLFMVMTAVFNILLSRYAGQDDICIGTPVANRNEAATEPLIGFFVNTLVLRTRIDPHARFDTLLAQVRNALLDDFAHQDLPFEKLVDLLNPVRQTGSSPLFQVMLSLQNTPAQGIDLPGITLQGLEGEHVNAKFDLTLNLVEAGGELAAAWEYDTALFAPATVARMARHLTSLISSIVRRPD